MESPSGRRAALWDAVQAAEDRAVADFLPSAGRALGPSCGDDTPGRSVAPCNRPAGPVPGPVAPEVAPPVTVRGPLAAVLVGIIRAARGR